MDLAAAGTGWPDGQRILYKEETDMAAEIVVEISELLQKGRAKNVKNLVQEALDQGIDPKEILNDGLLAGMMVVGGKFKRNEVFVPEVLVAARTQVLRFWNLNWWRWEMSRWARQW